MKHGESGRVPDGVEVGVAGEPNGKDGATTTIVLGREEPAAAEGVGGCLVQINGEGLGARFELGAGPTRFGRDADNDVVLEFDSVSRRHCQVAVGAGLVAVTDLGSTNGTFVADRRLEANSPVELQSGDLLQIGALIFKFLEGGDVESTYHDEIYKSSVIDPLTRAYNRRYLFDHLTREMARAHRHSRPLALILFDLDHFKAINDEHGHLAGDHVLRELAELVGANIRREDCCARFGGEEFAVCSSENDLAATCLLAEKLRGLIEVNEFRYEGHRIPVTISLGVTMMSRDMLEPADLVGAADALLYEAKRRGRNCIAS